MKDHVKMLKRLQSWRPRDRREIRLWVAIFLGMRMPERSVCAGHQTPLDYLAHAFLEEGQGRASGSDAIVWACRGGGKTMVGAIATLLDLLFKPGIQIRILGGSLEQSDKMYAYLRQLVERHFSGMTASPPTQRRLVLKNGSRVDVLAQSDCSVRGQRVQKLRCDEVELFDPAVWQAAQLTTRSLGGARPIGGAIEAFSTMHKPGGLMQRILGETGVGEVGGVTSAGRRVFSWCIWDVIARCPPERECARCVLWDGCRGRAKTAEGFVPVEDVITMRGRISRGTWEHEMLCRAPRFDDAVFPAFRREVHVRAFDKKWLVKGPAIFAAPHFLRLESVIGGVDYGYRNPFVCLLIAVFRVPTGGGNVTPALAGQRVFWVYDEMVSEVQTVAKNASLIGARFAEGAELPTLYCDIAGRSANSQTGVPDERVLKAAGFAAKSSYMEIGTGIAMMTDLLDPATGGARLWIDPGCRRLIEAMEGYRKGLQGKPEKDGRHDHLIDALRYALVNHERPCGKLEVRNY